MSINEYLVGLSSQGFNPKNILDIGANTGEFSLFCKRIWNNANFLMIEGNDNCENDLMYTGLPYVISLLGDGNRKVNFFINRENIKCTGSSYYKEVTHHYYDCISVEKELVMLDDLTSESFDIIKIDTQGSELDIIRGGIGTVSKSKYVILEVATKQYNSGAPLFDEVVSYMKSIGFDKYDIIENHIWNSNSIGDFNRGDVFQVDVVFKNNYNQ